MKNIMTKALMVTSFALIAHSAVAAEGPAIQVTGKDYAGGDSAYGAFIGNAVEACKKLGYNNYYEMSGRFSWDSVEFTGWVTCLNTENSPWK